MTCANRRGSPTRSPTRKHSTALELLALVVVASCHRQTTGGAVLLNELLQHQTCSPTDVAPLLAPQLPSTDVCTTNTQNTEEDGLLKLDLQMMNHTVIRGFPMLTAATVYNCSAGWYSNLPELNLGLLSGPSTSVLEFRGQDGAVVVKHTLDPRVVAMVDNTYFLEAGMRRRFLLDMGSRVVDLPVGVYNLRMAVADDVAGTLSFELVEPNATDKAILDSWFGHGGVRPYFEWEDFLLDGWFTPASGQGLSEPAAEAMLYYRFVHFVTYGPKPLAAQDASALLTLTNHVAYPEFALFQHEILVARGDHCAADALAKEILERWPYFIDEVTSNREGEGFLSHLRTSYGAESDRARKPGAVLPYEGSRPPRLWNGQGAAMPTER